MTSEAIVSLIVFIRGTYRNIPISMAVSSGDSTTTANKQTAQTNPCLTIAGSSILRSTLILD
jgi:hypothetical protein